MKSKKNILIISLLIFLINCIGFNQRTLSSYNQPNFQFIRSNLFNTVSLDIDADNPVLKNANIPKEQRSKAYTDISLKAFQDSGLFDSVKINHENPDLKAELLFRSWGENSTGKSIWYLGSLFTLFLIPFQTTATTELTIIFRDSEGKELKRVVRQEQISYWYQISFLVVKIFLSTRENEQEAFYHLVKSALIECQDAGLFTKSKQPEKIRKK